MDDPEVLKKMPDIGDVILSSHEKDIDESFVVVKEYTPFFLCKGVKTGARECFNKVCFALNEYELKRIAVIV